MPVWGDSFAGLNTNNLNDKTCHLDSGLSVCCSIFEETEIIYVKTVRNLNPYVDSCIITKTYIPSQYEIDQFELAASFDKIANSVQRRMSLLGHITSERDLTRSYQWMTRVGERMKYPSQFPDDFDSSNVIDRQYLSRFNITKKCPRRPLKIWTEWIEPISLHGRNPFSLLTCDGHNRNSIYKRYPHFAEMIRRSTLINTDHILLRSNVGNKEYNAIRGGNSYLFDAGTSTFQSSLWWFICMYGQHNLSFDRVFGWESTLLEPEKFWLEVPAQIRPKYSFYNTKINANSSHGNSPLRMIKQITHVRDFVALKLDVDTPEVEIPIALEILKDPAIGNLIDEFFFELHFRCDLLMHCSKKSGWGDRIPNVFLGLELSRLSAMIFFQQLRRLGIRSHFWP